MKLILILFVIGIHSDTLFGVEPTPDNVVGYDILRYIVTVVDVMPVPLFFVLSGYLFFFGVSNFNLEVYRSKQRRRFRSLFVRYMGWSIICAAVILLKIFLLGIPDPVYQTPEDNFKVWAFDNLCSLTFFIYAFHQILIPPFLHTVHHIFGVTTDHGLILGYVTDFILLFSVSYSAFVICKRLFPRFTTVMTGGRTD